jgi:hypothetical protein
MWSWRTYKRPSLAASNEGGHSTGDTQYARGSELPDDRQALAKVAEEFARARRYERPLTVAVLVVEDAPSARSPADRRPAALAIATRQAMREVDIICEADPGRCVVVIPEAGPEEARRAIRRTCQSCAERLGRSLRVGLATYPSDGWTFPDLVEAAERHVAVSDQLAETLTPRDVARPAPEAPSFARIVRGEGS